MAGGDRRQVPPGPGTRPGTSPGYAEPQPRDREDARRGVKPPPDPEDGGLAPDRENDPAPGKD